jgi:hypothetical protein
MAEPPDHASYVPQAAKALGLPIEPRDLPDVIGAFAVLMRAAGQVMTADLPEDLVGAAVFRPGEGEAQ